MKKIKVKCEAYAYITGIVPVEMTLNMPEDSDDVDIEEKLRFKISDKLVKKCLKKSFNKSTIEFANEILEFKVKK